MSAASARSAPASAPPRDSQFAPYATSRRSVAPKGRPSLWYTRATRHHERGDAALTTSWQIGTLANGLRVVTTPLPTSQSASVNLFIRAGSRAEEPRYNRLFHYLAHI